MKASSMVRLRQCALKVSYCQCCRSPIIVGEWSKVISSPPFSPRIVIGPYHASLYLPAYFSRR